MARKKTEEQIPAVKQAEEVPAAAEETESLPVMEEVPKVDPLCPICGFA